MMSKHQRIRSKFDNVVKGMGDLTTYLAECHAMKFSDRVIISVRRTNSVTSIECKYHGPLLQQIVSSGWLFINSFIIVKKSIQWGSGILTTDTRTPYYLIHYPSSPFYRYLDPGPGIQLLGRISRWRIAKGPGYCHMMDTRTLVS